VDKLADKIQRVSVLKGLFMVNEEPTTLVVQRYLNDLAGDAPAEPIVRAILERAVHRLQGLCSHFLHRNYPRLTRPPSNLDADELLSGVVEGLLKAMRTVRPQTVRELFALANQHMRWLLNDLARRLDDQPVIEELRDDQVPAPASSDSGISPDGRRMLAAIDNLPEDEREVFGLVRLQGLSHAEAAQILDVSSKTVQRRLNRASLLLADELNNLRPN
jgi:RNA polymerase sigma factor (sigma-70 family)